MISRDSETYIHRAKPMHYFMTKDHIDGTIYKMKIDKNKAPIIETVSNLKIPNMGGILVSTGYNLGISMPDKNKSGNKCRLEQARPWGYGNCIPKDLKKYNQYLKGGKFYNISELITYYRKTIEAKRYYPRPTTRRARLLARARLGRNYWLYVAPNPLPPRTTTIVRQRNWHGGMRSYNAVMGRKDANPGSFNYHTDTHGYSSCWDRGTASCHYAYGINLFKHMNIIPHVDFFNEFYANPEKRAEHRARFKNGDFSKLDPYF